MGRASSTEEACSFCEEATSRPIRTLLGIQFAAREQLLAPGDRIILHTDGAEDVFRRGADSGRAPFIALINRLRHLDAGEMTFQLAAEIDAMQGSLHPADDITLLVLDVAA